MLPAHVAIIMDGNGRWALKRGRPRVYGHIRGAQKVQTIVETASACGIKVLTLYAFSTENWTRPQAEIQVLWKILQKFLTTKIDQLQKQNVRLHVLGELERFPKELQFSIQQAVAALSQNTGLQLCFALSYGSQRELSTGFKNLLTTAIQNGQSVDQISVESIEKNLSHYLWTKDLQPYDQVDFLIRTSGEQRLSNFLLWQAAYAEFYFTPTLWPDFGEKEFRTALKEFATRDRRFGGTPSAPLFPTSSGGALT